VATAVEHPLVLYCSSLAYRSKPDVVTTLGGSGVEVVSLPERDRRLPLDDCLLGLGKLGATHLLVEPGPSLADAFLAADLADRVWVFRSRMIAGDRHAPQAPVIAYQPGSEIELAGDRLTEYLNPKSAVFFAQEPSADFVLTRDAV
jgi:riboflavin biosynthesis pyrimidine reductase